MLNTQKYTVDICVNGKPVKYYYHNNSVYIEGRKATEYTIRLRNNTAYKALFTVSVDGLNVIDGNPAKEDTNGYIISPWSSYDVKGFRYSNESVGAFKFSEKRNSYSKSSGNGTQNCGVIAVLVWEENVYIPNYTINTVYKNIGADNTWYKSIPDNNHYNFTTTRSFDFSSSLSACSFSASNESYQSKQPFGNFSLGTEWGSKIEDKVVEAEFNARDTYFEKIVFFYDTHENLVNSGIIPKNKVSVARPNPFPGNFAKPPAGWNR